MNEKWIGFEKELKGRAYKNYDRISEYNSSTTLLLNSSNLCAFIAPNQTLCYCSTR